MMKKWFKVVTFSLFLLLVTGCGKKAYKTIDANEAMNLINNNKVEIIDVRNMDEYNTGHIANAKNVPLEGIDNISYDKNTIIILYCASGMRSMKAAEKLSEMGYTNLYNLDGGLLNWGFDLE